MSKTKKNINSDNLIIEIERLFKDTKTKLNELHVKKMELIKYYRDLENKNELAKIRAKIKQS